MLDENTQALAALAHLDAGKLEISKKAGEKPEGHVALVAGPVEIYLPLSKIVDPAEERGRLEADLAGANAQIQRLEQLLGSDFARKAPKDVVEKEQARLDEYKQIAERLAEQLNKLK